ncbi:DHH family phosphoesterase [Candidatus Peregrinibacteria bacterium]|nr:DHH family phosphoesterase [Candidatus Peregrinibacteria bacterium]
MKAVRAREKIAIFGDYDCDGICSAAQLTRFFRRRGMEPFVRLPHRIREGYGLSAKAIDECAAQGTTLLLTADTGVTAIAEIERARERGMDVIVLDHHHVKEELPPAYAILHPALAPAYPKPHPAAAGIVFQFIDLLEGGSWADRETDLVLAMIGTIADLVELRGLNRSIVKAGLLALQRLGSGPLATMRDDVRSTAEPLTSRDIAFRIAPRLNAAGRMADPAIALRAVLGDFEALCALTELNHERQMTTASLLEEVLGFIDEKSSQPFLCCASETYPAGIVGLLSGKLTDAYGKPSMVGCVHEGICRASLRSIPGYNVMDALTHAGGLLLTYGGHAQAAGCTFKEELLPKLEERLCAHMRSTIPCDDLRPVLAVDAVIAPEVLTLDFCHMLQRLEPFGQGNIEPRFCLEHVTLERCRTVGTDGAHLQARIGEIPVIGFRLGNLVAQLKGQQDIACRVALNRWSGETIPQVVLEDIRAAQYIGVRA